MDFSIKIFYGKELLQWLDFIAQLRLTEFKEFPYLYIGNLDIEKKYLASYATDNRSVFTLAFHNDEIAGVLTGTPFVSDLEPVPGGPEIFKKHGLQPQDFYYYGEFIVIPKYRGHGITRKLFSQQTAYVKSLGYKSLCLMTVDREPKHPLKPKNYINTDPIWEKLGFSKTDMKINIE